MEVRVLGSFRFGFAGFVKVLCLRVQCWGGAARLKL